MDWQSKMSVHSSQEGDWWGWGGGGLGVLGLVHFVQVAAKNGLFLGEVVGVWWMGRVVRSYWWPLAVLPNYQMVHLSRDHHGTLCGYTLAHRYAIFLCSWDDSLWATNKIYIAAAEFDGLLFSSSELQQLCCFLACIWQDDIKELNANRIFAKAASWAFKCNFGLSCLFICNFVSSP